MSEESNKAAALRIFSEIWNQGNLDTVDELYAEDFVDNDLIAPGLPPGQAGAKAVFASFLQAFPGLNTTVTLTVAESDKVVVRYEVTATHTGPLMNIPPTGRSGKISGVEIVRFRDGKIAERWGNFDMFGLLQQLGVIPASGE